MKRKGYFSCLILNLIFMMLFMAGCEHDKTQEENESKMVEEAAKRQEFFMTFVKSDQSCILKEDYEQISAMEDVSYAEWYGMADRINYYVKEGADYEMKSVVYEPFPEEFRERENFTPLDDSHFIRSSAMLSEKDLKTGVMPEEMNEIAVWSDDESLLGKNITIFFMDRAMMKSTEDMEEYAFEIYRKGADNSDDVFGWDRYVLQKDFMVTGILKDQDPQIYFSPEFCKMAGTVYGNYIYTDFKFYLYPEEHGSGIVNILEDIRQGNVKVLDSVQSFLKETGSEGKSILCGNNYREWGVVVYNEECGENELRISRDMVADYYFGNEPLRGYYWLYNILYAEYNLPIWQKQEKDVVTLSDEFNPLKETKSNSIGVNKNGDKVIGQQAFFTISETTHDSGLYILEAGKNIYERLYGTEGSKQITVFAENQERLETIREQMKTLGYEEYHVPATKEMENYLYSDE